MKIAVGGCRGFNDYKSFCDSMEKVISEIGEEESITILSGHCSGTDLMAERYAAEQHFCVEIFQADWKRYGRAAGPIRNKLMAASADLVVAFWNGRSRGTKSLIEFAKRLGKTVLIFEIECT